MLYLLVTYFLLLHNHFVHHNFKMFDRSRFFKQNYCLKNLDHYEILQLCFAKIIKLLLQLWTESGLWLKKSHQMPRQFSLTIPQPWQDVSYDLQGIPNGRLTNWTKRRCELKILRNINFSLLSEVLITRFILLRIFILLRGLVFV